MIFFVSLKDLSSIEGRDLASGSETEVITRLREVYNFLPRQTDISVKDGIVRIDIPEQVIANKLEAARLQEKASQRAKQGEYQKAAGIFSRVLELDPTNVKVRRDLGMTYVELGEPEKAKEHLIEAAIADVSLVPPPGRRVGVRILMTRDVFTPIPTFPRQGGRSCLGIQFFSNPAGGFAPKSRSLFPARLSCLAVP